MTQHHRREHGQGESCELLSNLYLCIGWHSIFLFWKLRRLSCELLSNLYLCIGWHSAQHSKEPIQAVVNCFQICIFVSDDTAYTNVGRRGNELWIAFKFVSLYRMTQLNGLYCYSLWVVNCFQICIFVSDDTAYYGKTAERSSCELLSNLYLCIGWHSDYEAQYTKTTVVNCFQICIFVSDDTALFVLIICLQQLWIAFKFVSLYRMTQPAIMKWTRRVRCELLSNLYLCIGWHSPGCNPHATHRVVNCFQICIFVSDDTAHRVRRHPCQRCELLSNLYLCIGWHSVGSAFPKISLVVNCFQICIFVSDDTACALTACDRIMLWIAFKFVSLYRMTQLLELRELIVVGCELLSNLYLCIGWHSKGNHAWHSIGVVNCFQICIFVSDDTALMYLAGVPLSLWIAFKFVSLYRMTQRSTLAWPWHSRCELLSNLYLCIGWHSEMR